MRKTKKKRKQTSLPIEEIKVNRKCDYGTCDGDLAFVVNGVDLCFKHGSEALGATWSRMKPDGKVYEVTQSQLRLS